MEVVELLFHHVGYAEHESGAEQRLLHNSDAIGQKPVKNLCSAPHSYTFSPLAALELDANTRMCSACPGTLTALASEQ